MSSQNVRPHVFFNKLLCFSAGWKGQNQIFKSNLWRQLKNCIATTTLNRLGIS